MADAELSALLEQRAQLKIAETVGRKNGRAAAWYEERPAEQRFVGLLNQGATCYLNSLVQALFMLPAVREKVFSFEFDADRHGAAETCVPLQLGVLFARLATSSLHALDTRPSRSARAIDRLAPLGTGSTRSARVPRARHGR